MANNPMPPHVEHLSAALGVPLYSPDWYMPPYRDGCIGRWKITHGGFHLDYGYWSGNWGVWGMPVLLRDSHGDGQTWETWMSLSPHEIESQEFGCRYAHGHSVVMGLGMGWVAANMALNPAVSLVSVIERDPEVIALFGQTDPLLGMAPDIRSKIRIIPGDALEWRPDVAVDFLYADIWRTLEEPQTLDDVRRMQANVAAPLIYFWGQELAIHRLCDFPEGEDTGPQWASAVQRCITATLQLPLLCPEDIDYPERIARAARLRRERWPAGVPEGLR